MTVVDKDSTTWGMLAHISAFAGVIGVPFGNVLGPLIVWLAKRDQSEFIDYHGKEALNFQISLTIYMFISAILVLIVVGILLLIAIAVVGLVLTIVAAIKANNGEYYEYPLTIRFLK